MTDLPTCEWQAGSNRYTGSASEAVARLNLPPQVQNVLTEKMRTHRFDDVVKITDWRIESKGNLNSYAPGIINMNFGSGRLCKTVMRAKWSATQHEEALVYLVEGRAYGWAAVCGNFFELTRIEGRPEPVGAVEALASGNPAGAMDRATATGAPVQQIAAVDALLSDVAEAGMAAVGGAALVSFAGGGPTPDYVYLPPSVDYTNATIAAIPEPWTSALMVMGLAALLFVRKWSTK